MKRSIKHDVRLRGLSAEMALADQIVASVFEELGAEELVITSATDGKHMPGSKHHCGDALDYRRRTLDDLFEHTGDDTPRNPLWAKALAVLRERLGPTFDVVLEDSHLHVEYDPK